MNKPPYYTGEKVFKKWAIDTGVAAEAHKAAIDESLGTGRTVTLQEWVEEAIIRRLDARRLEKEC